MFPITTLRALGSFERGRPTAGPGVVYCCLWVAALWVAAILPARAQHNLVLYNMQQVPQSHLLNPGQIPLVKAHFGLPVISGIRLEASNSGFSYNQFDLANTGDVFDFAGLIDQPNPNGERFGLGADLNALSIGFRAGKGYFHFNVESRLIQQVNYHSNMLDILDKIQQGWGLDEASEIIYDLSGFGLNGLAYHAYSVGYAREWLPGLSLGARFRYLQGIAGVWAENDRLMFQYEPGTDDLQVEGRMNILAAGLGNFSGEFSANTLLPQGNTGMAFDIGGVYRLSESIELSFSALDLGQINWKNDVNYQVISDHLQFSALDEDDFLDTWENTGDNLREDVPDSSSVRFTTPLPARFYFGGNYYLGPNTSLGLLVNPVRFSGTTNTAVALSANTRVGKILGLSAALTRDRHHNLSLGVGTSLSLGYLQIYAVTDNISSVFDLKNARSVRAQIGVNLNFGKIKRKSAPLETEAVATTDQPLDSENKPARTFENEPVPPPSPRVSSNKNTESSKPASKPKTSEPAGDANGSPPPPTNPDPFADAAPAQLDKKAGAQNAKSKTTSVNPEEGAESVADAAPASSAPSPSPDSDPPRALMLTGTAFDVITGEVVKGISVDAYRINAQGEKELAYTRGFYNGKLSVPIERGASYQIIVNRYGYQTKEVVLENGRFRVLEGEVQRDFALQPQTGSATPGTSTPAVESGIATPREEKTSKIETPEEPRRESPEEHSPIPYRAEPAPGYGTYQLTAATSFRKGPHHTHRVFLRFAPGDQVEVLEKTDKWWWKVRFRGQVGYVKAQLLTP